MFSYIIFYTIKQFVYLQISIPPGIYMDLKHLLNNLSLITSEFLIRVPVLLLIQGRWNY